jgi:hypothetical protein
MWVFPSRQRSFSTQAVPAASTDLDRRSEQIAGRMAKSFEPAGRAPEHNAQKLKIAGCVAIAHKRAATRANP